MPIDKRAGSAAEALADVSDGATVLISGFGGAGFPNILIRALRDRGPKNLTLVVNSAVHRYSFTHELIEAGPYRDIRHPSYTGALLSLLGFGLALGNWAGHARSSASAADRIPGETGRPVRLLPGRYIGRGQGADRQEPRSQPRRDRRGAVLAPLPLRRA